MRAPFISLILGSLCPGALAGQPFGDAIHPAACREIPGPVLCAYYDAGGEGIAYHDTEPDNRGSGKLNSADPIPWRQWHHWNVARDAVTLALPKGVSFITVRIVEGGNINLATLAFRPSGTDRKGPDIIEFKTPLPEPNKSAKS